jgi:nitrogen fixation NifU-like protein
MDEKREMSSGLRDALDQWAEETLEGIGIFKGKHADFGKWKEKVIEQLRSAYSDKTIEMFLRTKDNRKIVSPDGFARLTGSCGDTMEIFLKVEDGIIVDASFQTDGCNPSRAAGGMVAEMTKGKRVDDVKQLTAQTVLDALGGLPEDHEHCASLAADALKEALKDFARREKPVPKSSRRASRK